MGQSIYIVCAWFDATKRPKNGSRPAQAFDVLNALELNYYRLSKFFHIINWLQHRPPSGLAPISGSVVVLS